MKRYGMVIGVSRRQIEKIQGETSRLCVAVMSCV